MYDYRYANRNDEEKVERVTNVIENVLDHVYRSLKNCLPFDYEFVGAYSYNMITYEPDELNALEIDVDIFPEVRYRRNEEVKSYDIHRYFLNALRLYKGFFGYDIYENDDNIEISVQDSYSCCFYFVYDCTGDYAGLQRYIGYDYDEETYCWWNYTTEYRSIPKKVKWLKDNGFWNKFRADFLRIKNRNEDESPKVLFMDAVLQKCKEYKKVSKDPVTKAVPKKKARYDFEYVDRKRTVQVRQNIIELIKKVHEMISDKYTFEYQFIGSSARNMITEDKKGNIGFDVDINIIPRKIKVKDSPEYLRMVLFHAIQEVYKDYGFNGKIKNSTSVITITMVDHKNSKCLYSCDFAVVRIKKGRQQNIVLQKNNNKQSYVWADRGDYYAGLSERVAFLKKNPKYWNELRRYYIEKKNTNYCEDKKSRAIFVESVKEICDKYGYHK